MTYSLERLAPGSYDVLLDGEIVAALARTITGKGGAALWHAELLTALPAAARPAPFVQSEHQFGTFAEACAWLGVSDEANG
jgi:hypothetical protein